MTDLRTIVKQLTHRHTETESESGLLDHPTGTRGSSKPDLMAPDMILNCLSYTMCDLFLRAGSTAGRRETSESPGAKEVIPIKFWIEGFSAQATTQCVSIFYYLLAR